MTVFDYYPGIMRRLQNEQLANLLAALQNVWAGYAKIKNNRDIATNNIAYYNQEIKKEAQSRLNAIAVVIGVVPALWMLIELIKANYVWGILLGVPGALGLGISLWAIIKLITKIKAIQKATEARIEPKYRKNIEEEKSNHAKWELKRREYWNSIEMTKVNEFLTNEGTRLNAEDGDLYELWRIVHESYANTIGEALNVLDDRKAKRKMLSLEKQRLENERAHQHEMEVIAVNTQRSIENQEREMKYHNEDMRRKAEDIAKDARRAADAEEERTRTVNSFFRGY